MIMGTVTDGAYGIPILPTEGAFTITKNIVSIVSGNFEGKLLEGNKHTIYSKDFF
jgi:hypothetical protein